MKGFIGGFVSSLIIGALAADVNSSIPWRFPACRDSLCYQSLEKAYNATQNMDGIKSMVHDCTITTTKYLQLSNNVTKFLGRASPCHELDKDIQRKFGISPMRMTAPVKRACQCVVEEYDNKASTTAPPSSVTTSPPPQGTAFAECANLECYLGIEKLLSTRRAITWFCNDRRGDPDYLGDPLNHQLFKTACRSQARRGVFDTGLIKEACECVKKAAKASTAEHSPAAQHIPAVSTRSVKEIPSTEIQDWEYNNTRSDQI